LASTDDYTARQRSNQKALFHNVGTNASAAAAAASTCSAGDVDGGAGGARGGAMQPVEQGESVIDHLDTN
jgi:hypothetical protein